MIEPNLAVICPQCQIPVASCEEGYFVKTVEGSDQQEFLRFTLVRCPKCSTPILLKHDGWYEGDAGRAWGRSVVLYPAITTSFGEDVPPFIALSYLEAVRAFEQAGAYTATAILCRRTLEGICGDFDGEGRNLSQKLRSLLEKGVIDTRVFQWADLVLRGLGNDAAHNINVMIARQDAKDALDFTRAIIEYLYVFQSAFNRFMATRAKRTEPEAGEVN